MDRFNFWNKLVGWGVFFIATISYLLTMEPTTSLWDCSEFIATSYKLEVGHPPGAPLFMMLARIASLLAPSPEDVPMMVNSMNCIASGFCILFLFWTITHLARRIMFGRYNSANELFAQKNMSTGHIIQILGAGVVGALSYAYTDTFWFSAVEGEVYAMSSMFTALVVWLMLRWEENADRVTSMRWIILIAYLMGLSIGVHILNLLTIPALVMIYFFRRYECKSVSRYILMMGGALLLSLLILGVINGIIIPYTVAIGAAIDTFAVNTLGMPVNSGMIIFILVVFTLLGIAIYTTHKAGYRVLNGIAIALTVILIGFSSYASVTIRASANPPMNSNNPSTPHTLLSLLNRDQYGQRPLLFGPYYSATPLPMTEATSDNSEDNYYNPTGEYESREVMWLNPETNRYEAREMFEGYRYPDEANRFMPRMWDYKRRDSYQATWIDLENGHPSVERSDAQAGVWYEPTAGEDIGYFFNYQMGQMFGRYFLWNFVGRQDDAQVVYDAGNQIFLHGGWLSGIDVIDELFAGPQTNLPSEMADNNARNTYFFLPLLLGLLGLIYQLNTDWRNFIVVMLLFVMMGIALVVYFNTAPDEPRERDYVYAGAFYAFCIWIGLGVIAIGDMLTAVFSIGKRTLSNRGVTALSVVTLLLTASVPAVLATENWDDHDRSNRYYARAIGRNFLNTVPENAILINFGDNDTFPLWYCQEVEDERTDVRVMNSSYLGGEWYIDEMKLAANDADGIPFTIPSTRYSFVNDWVMVADIADVLDNSAARALRSDKHLIENMGYYTIRYENANGVMSTISGTYRDITNRLMDAQDAINQYEPIIEQAIASGENISNDVYSIYLALIDAYDTYDAIINDARFMEDYARIDEYWTLNDTYSNYPIYLSDAIEQFSTDEKTTLVLNDGCLHILAEGESIPVDQRSDDYTVVGKLLPKVDSYLDGKPSDYILRAASYLIPVDREAVLETGLLSQEEAENMVEELSIPISKTIITKDHLMMLDLLANFNWQRPISFTQTHLMSDYGVINYARFDGYSYTLVPIFTRYESGRDVGCMNIDALYPLFMGEEVEGRRPLEFGNIGSDDVNADYFVRYNLSASRARENYARVALAFIARGNEDNLRKAENLLDRGLELLPGEQLGYQFSNTQPYIQGYYTIGNSYLEMATSCLADATSILNNALGLDSVPEPTDDIFALFYDYSDLVAELQATVRHRMSLGQTLNIDSELLADADELCVTSDYYFELAEELFGKGDSLTVRYIAKRGEWANYYMQFTTYDAFSLTTSNELYTAMLDIIDALRISHEYAGSFDWVSNPSSEYADVGAQLSFDELTTDYLAAIKRLTPSSVSNPMMHMIEPHILNLFDIYSLLPAWRMVDGDTRHAPYATDLDEYLNSSAVSSVIMSNYGM